MHIMVRDAIQSTNNVFAPQSVNFPGRCGGLERHVQREDRGPDENRTAEGLGEDRAGAAPGARSPGAQGLQDQPADHPPDR